MSVFHYEGMPLRYRTCGDGEPVLLIHGLGSSGADWEMQIAALAPRFRLIVPDLPGGGSDSPPAALSIAFLSTALWALLDSLQVDTTNVVGFSLGGAVAMEMALQCPKRAARLGLINSLPCYSGDWRKWLFARRSEILVRCAGMRRAAMISASALFPEPWQQPLRERAAAVVATVPADSYLAMSSALERWSAVGRLHQITSRTLVIAAEHDHTPMAEKYALAAELGGSLLLVTGSRHGTPFDSVAATNAGLWSLLSADPRPPYFELPRDAPGLTQALFAAGETAPDAETKAPRILYPTPTRACG